MIPEHCTCGCPRGDHQPERAGACRCGKCGWFELCGSRAFCQKHGTPPRWRWEAPTIAQQLVDRMAR